MKIGRGKVVSIHYTLTGDDGEILDTTTGHPPMAYLHGSESCLPALEATLEGRTAGHRGKVTLEPQDAYGRRDEDAVFEAPRDSFPDDAELTPGMEVEAEGDDGPVLFTVVEVKESGVVLDGNHPMAGKRLHFEVEVVDVRDATAEESAHGHAHGAGSRAH